MEQRTLIQRKMGTARARNAIFSVVLWNHIYKEDAVAHVRLTESLIKKNTAQRKGAIIVAAAGFKDEVSPTFKMHYAKNMSPGCESAGGCLNGS